MVSSSGNIYANRDRKILSFSVDPRDSRVDLECRLFMLSFLSFSLFLFAAPLARSISHPSLRVVQTK